MSAPPSPFSIKPHITLSGDGDALDYGKGIALGRSKLVSWRLAGVKIATQNLKFGDVTVRVKTINGREFVHVEADGRCYAAPVVEDLLLQSSISRKVDKNFFSLRAKKDFSSIKVYPKINQHYENYGSGGNLPNGYIDFISSKGDIAYIESLSNRYGFFQVCNFQGFIILNNRKIETNKKVCGVGFIKNKESGVLELVYAAQNWDDSKPREGVGVSFFLLSKDPDTKWYTNTPGRLIGSIPASVLSQPSDAGQWEYQFCKPVFFSESGDFCFLGEKDFDPFHVKKDPRNNDEGLNNVHHDLVKGTINIISLTVDSVDIERTPTPYQNRTTTHGSLTYTYRRWTPIGAEFDARGSLVRLMALYEITENEVVSSTFNSRQIDGWTLKSGTAVIDSESSTILSFLFNDVEVYRHSSFIYSTRTNVLRSEFVFYQSKYWYFDPATGAPETHEPDPYSLRETTGSAGKEPIDLIGLSFDCRDRSCVFFGQYGKNINSTFDHNLNIYTRNEGVLYSFIGIIYKGNFKDFGVGGRLPRISQYAYGNNLEEQWGSLQQDGINYGFYSFSGVAGLGSVYASAKENEFVFTDNFKWLSDFIKDINSRYSENYDIPSAVTVLCKKVNGDFVFLKHPDSSISELGLFANDGKSIWPIMVSKK